jgi:aerobic carbon-monoxide dehydrogenase medium subunit
MTPFELIEPATLGEVIAALDPDDPSVRPIAGGTALMLIMKSGVFKPSRLVSLRRVESRFTRIEIGDGMLRIGALAPLSSLERAPAVRKGAPVVVQTLRSLSNVRVRNVATIGGSLAHADPHMDLPPVLIALGAHVEVMGPAGERTVAVEDLFAGYFETVLARNELITALIVPAKAATAATYVKCTTRSADDWPALGIAVALDMHGAAVRKADIVISAATAKPTRLKAAEAVVRGARIDDAILARAGEAAAAEAELIADVRGSVPYKKQLLRVHVARAIRQALTQSLQAGAQ